MTHYLITLTPVGLFFFGGEQTFGDGANANYFARSNPFPQQTTLLGMLRKEVLIQSDLFKENPGDYNYTDKTAMNSKIGGKSFDIASTKAQDFGVIKSLSPLFIVREKESVEKGKGKTNMTYFIPCPKDHGLIFDKVENGCACLDHERDFIPFFENYKAKAGLPNAFLSSDLRESIPFDTVLKPYVKIGIDKERPEDEDDDGKFFKHQFYRMEKGFSFAFFAEVDMKLKDTTTVFMGADSSSFCMKVEEVKGRSFEVLFDKIKSSDKITLLSDAYVDPSIYKSCLFAITDTVDFQNIRTSSGVYGFKKDGKDKSKSGKYTFLKRGSVFFVKNPEKRKAVKDCLNKTPLQNIGYNHFI